MILTLDGIFKSSTLIDDVIVICVNDEHFSKRSFPISITFDERISICFNDEHSWKTPHPIEVTDDGITI